MATRSARESSLADKDSMGPLNAAQLAQFANRASRNKVELRPFGVSCNDQATGFRRIKMGGIIYLVGLVVVILAILSFFGLR